MLLYELRFNEFIISNACLKDPNIWGRKFTYMSVDGLKLRKVDRFLVCLNFIKFQPISFMTTMPHEFIGRSLVVLKVSYANFGPYPFRSFL